MVWYNPFDPCRDPCIETVDGNTIDMTPDGASIGFSSHVPMYEGLIMLPHI